MDNLLIVVMILLLTFGRTISIREAAVADGEAMTASLLVTLNQTCTADIKEITRDVIDHVMQMCNCTVILSLLQCCIGNHAVYNFTLSQISKLDSVSTKQCNNGNCTCDSNSPSSSSPQVMLLILEIICSCLLLLVLLTVSFICYKCYRLCRQGEKVISMTPCPAPLPSNSIRQRLPVGQNLQRIAMATVNSDYIEPSEIASPTLPPTLHQSIANNVQSTTVDVQSTTVDVQSTTVDVQSTTVDVQSTTLNIQSTVDMHSNMESIANSSTIAQQDNNGYVDHSIATAHQQSTIPSLDGKITTPSGLVATIIIPAGLNAVTETSILSSELIKQSTTNDVQLQPADEQSAISNTQTTANSSTFTKQRESCIISSKHYPGYVEHTIK